MATDFPSTPPAGDAASPAKVESPFWIWALYVVYCAEAGVTLTLIPWTRHWNENGLFLRWPALIPPGTSGFTRGAVTALGLCLLFLSVESLVRRIRGIALFTKRGAEKEGSG